MNASDKRGELEDAPAAEKFIYFIIADEHCRKHVIIVRRQARHGDY